ncbi:MAG: GDP-mannose 4,6-dehydratase, partial [Planctomycetaceae bacterium]
MIAVITGITGQDGSYLAELLLGKGYEVHGIVRRSSSLERVRLSELYHDPQIYGSRLHLHYADLTDTTTIRRIVMQVQPTEFYHLAGQSHVGLSFEIPESTCELTAMATLRIMEILRDLPRPPRFLHASSREIFGTPPKSPQDESTPVNPNSPYGCAKAFATQMTKIYRESHGLFFCNAICYNHESPRRGEN